MTEEQFNSISREQLLKVIISQDRKLEEASEKLRETEKESEKKRTAAFIRNAITALLVAAAVVVLLMNFWFPILRIYGDSMAPTLEKGNIVVASKTSQLETGDLIAFYYNNKILIKRVIAQSGDWVDIDKKGNVFINNEKLDEPYIREKALGTCDIDLPYQVPESRIFVMGDHRAVSIDSRSESIGDVSEEQIVGKILFRLSPMKKIGNVN